MLGQQSLLYADSLDVEDGGIRAGNELYNFYCYQCHGYSGDANTLASTWLDPPPANFTRNSLERLTRESMLITVRNGRPGTAMMSFSSVMNETEIEAVVDYIRRELIAGEAGSRRYHTRENGWPDHDRYASAYPFVTGEIPLDIPWEKLDEQQHAGKLLYMNACITCHDHGGSENSEISWEIRSVSFPRDHYSHRLDEIDVLSGASVHRMHDIPPAETGMTDSEKRGRRLYLDNCAFCHAQDGSARNWIGSFLTPRPRQFRGSDFIYNTGNEELETIIQDGVPGTSMPAWKHVLTQNQVRDIVRFLRKVFTEPES